MNVHDHFLDEERKARQAREARETHRAEHIRRYGLDVAGVSDLIEDAIQSQTTYGDCTDDAAALRPQVTRGVIVDDGDALAFRPDDAGRLIQIAYAGAAFVIHEDPAHDLLKALTNVLL